MTPLKFALHDARTLVTLAVASVTLAACASHPKPPPPAPVTQAPSVRAPAPYSPPPREPVHAGPLPGSAQDFVVNVGDRIYFDLDQYRIRDEARPVLVAQAAWLNRYPAVQVRIEGNCDERGTREYNMALGARRANSVKEFLVGQGVAAGRIATVSYGKERPIDMGTGESAWRRDRNAHTAILSGAR